jgi:hypothetical protein
MLKKWMLVAGLLPFGFAGALQAHPMDSPDIVYIDGLPCNSACQSYMDWSRRMSSASRRPEATQPAKHATDAAARHTPAARAETLKPRASAPVAKQAVPMPREMPRTGIAALPPADNSAPKSDTPKSDTPKSDTPKSDTMAAKTADLPAAASVTANPGIRTIQQQVAAATALAERASPNDTDHLIALVMARAEIKSVSDLANKDIAIEDGQSASSASLRTAVAAAGATEAQLSESRTRAIDRLVDGEVPAAVLALVSPEAAEWFPEIKGFRIFRIPLSPGSSKARL